MNEQSVQRNEKTNYVPVKIFANINLRGQK